MGFCNDNDIMQFLDKQGLFHMDFSLNRLQNACIDLQISKLPFYAVQIVGTNGKGSTATILESIARLHNKKPGLFTSPHFLNPRERILIDGKFISKDLWLEIFNQIAKYTDIGILTYFEILTIVAVLAFAKSGVEIAIMEAGLGGTNDATCVFDYNLLLLTKIGMDHEAYLGNTLTAIATEKSGAIKANLQVFSASQKLEVETVLKEKAQIQNAKLQIIPKPTSSLLKIESSSSCKFELSNLALCGKHQWENASLALHAWCYIADKLGLKISPELCETALTQTSHFGRLQFVKGKPSFLLDGAHNPDGLETLLNFVNSQTQKPDTIIFGCMNDKNITLMLEIINKLNIPNIIFCGLPNNNRAEKPEQLRMAFGSGKIAKDMQEALQLAENEKFILVCGSLYLLAEFYKLNANYFFAQLN